MQINFTFDRNDPIVRAHLTATEIGTVTHWQQNTEYMFEWHPGHGTGYPLYVRPRQNTTKSNLPKFDTLNHTGAEFRNITDLSNGNVLRRDLGNAAQQELLTLIQNEWDALSTLAERMWKGENVGEGKSLLELWADEETEETGQHPEEISRDQLHKILGLRY